MSRKGIFVVIDGPNGVGKSTVLQKCRELLNQLHISNYQTNEPTKTELGQFIRKNQDLLSKEVLACLVAANRYEHLSSVVIPQMEDGQVVISDRYYPSSLVYQRIDGLDMQFIEALNQRILKPDLTVLLFAGKDILIERIKARNSVTRFESKAMKDDDEIQFYREASKYLDLNGWNVIEIENEGPDVAKVADRIVDAIRSLRGRPS